MRTFMLGEWAETHPHGHGAKVQIVQAPMPSGGGVNAPLVDQLHEPTSDNMPDENASYNCVFASETSAIKALEPGVNVNGDMIHDATYGQGHIGGSAAEVTAPYILSQFHVVVETDHNADRHALRLRVQEELAKGIPVIITMPSAWNSQPSVAGYNPNSPGFSTHAGLAYWDTGTELWIMNPWGGFIHKGSYAYWELRFCWQKVYPMYLSGGATVALPATWKDVGGQLSNPANTNVVRSGFRDFILANPWDADDVPLENEKGDNRNGAAGSSQLFVKDGLVWDVAHGSRRDNVGQQLMSVRADLAAAQAQVAALKASAAGLSDAQKAAIAAATQAGDALKGIDAAAEAVKQVADAASAASDALKAAFPA